MSTPDQPAIFTIRSARPDDAAGILGVYAQGFPKPLLPLTALGCHGGMTYIAQLIREARRGGSSPFWVAGDRHDAVVGFVQWRLISDTAVINNIYVRHVSRGQRIGRRLLADSLQQLTWPFTLVELDVFADNPRAKRWYETLGFCEDGRRVWLEGPRPKRAGGDYLLEGLPQADAVQQVLGFSLFRVTTKQRVYRVGRLGEQWFRLFDPVALDDSALMSAIASIDAERKLFLLLDPHDAGTHSQLRPLATSIRMQAGRDRLLSLLKANTP